MSLSGAGIFASLRRGEGPQPPGPGPLYSLLRLKKLRHSLVDFLVDLNREYGHVVRVRGFRRQVYLINEPEYIQQVLVSEGRNFEKDHMLRLAREYLLGEGLLTAEGEFHRRQRKLISPVFRKKKIADYAETMWEYGEQMASQWGPMAGQELDVDQEMMRLTLAIVGRLLFDADVEDEANEIGLALSGILSFVPKLVGPFAPLLLKLPLPAKEQFFEYRDTIARTVYRMIEERMASDEEPKGDLLDMLLAARDEDDGEGMSPQQVYWEALTLFLAGHETTANALTWTLYLLGEHPEVESRFHAEVDEVIASGGTAFERFQRLQYTRHVLAESMRLFPPAHSIGRRVVEDFQMGPYRVPANSMVAMSPYIMHRDPRFWPQPERFWPERWVEREQTKPPKFAYFPFGGGARICIGEGFAWMEGVLLLAALGQRWKLRLRPGHRVEPQPVITLRSRFGMPMRLTPR